MGSPWQSISAKTSMNKLDGTWRMLVGRRTIMGSRHMFCLGIWTREIGLQQGEEKACIEPVLCCETTPQTSPYPEQEREQQYQHLARAIFPFLEKSPYFKTSPYNVQRFLSYTTITFTNCFLIRGFGFFFFPLGMWHRVI